MALLTCTLHSEALGTGATMTVVLPETTDDEGRVHRPEDPPVLYLLHGLLDDHTSWLRWSSAARYAERAGLAVVMPAAARSFYADEAHGHAYWTFVSEELPQVLRSYFGLTQDPESTYVAGLSMGGYGAFKLALRHPDRFAAAASMSGVLDLAAVLRLPDREDIRDRVFGGPPGPEDDLLALLDQSQLPRLWVGCGTEDELFGGNQTFVARAEEHGHDVTVDFRPGVHEWGLWDAMLADVVPWLVGPGPTEPRA